LSTSASLARPFLIVGVLGRGVVHLHLLLHIWNSSGDWNAHGRKSHKLNLSSFLVDGHGFGLLLEQVNGLASLAYRMS
jgi:hypothetical protein